MPNIRRQWFAFVYCAGFTGRIWRRLAFVNGHLTFSRFSPSRGDELAVVAIAEPVARNVVPDKAGGGIVNIGLVLVKRVLIGNRSAEIIRTFLAAISDLPRVLVIVAGNGGHRPIVSIARNLATVVEIVQDAELQCYLVQIWSDVGTVHGKRGIAIANLQVTEHLVVSTISFENVDCVADRIGCSCEMNLGWIRVQQIALLHAPSKVWQLFVDVRKSEPRNRAIEQCRNIRMLAVSALVLDNADAAIRAGSPALGGGNQQVITGSRESGGVPICRNKARGRLHGSCR